MPSMSYPIVLERLQLSWEQSAKDSAELQATRLSPLPSWASRCRYDSDTATLVQIEET